MLLHGSSIRTCELVFMAIKKSLCVEFDSLGVEGWGRDWRIRRCLSYCFLSCLLSVARHYSLGLSTIKTCLTLFVWTVIHHGVNCLIRCVRWDFCPTEPTDNRPSKLGCIPTTSFLSALGHSTKESRRLVYALTRSAALLPLHQTISKAIQPLNFLNFQQGCSALVAEDPISWLLFIHQ